MEMRLIFNHRHKEWERNNPNMEDEADGRVIMDMMQEWKAKNNNMF